MVTKSPDQVSLRVSVVINTTVPNSCSVELRRWVSDEQWLALSSWPSCRSPSREGFFLLQEGRRKGWGPIA